MTQLTDLIAKQQEFYRGALIAANATLDQISTDLAALQEREKAEQEAIKQSLIKLQRAQQAAFLQKKESQAALTALDQLVDASTK